MPNLEHVEICNCQGIAEYGLKELFTKCEKLTFADVSKIPIVNYAFLDELKESNPDLLIRRNIHEDNDFKKDNGLRVPRRIAGMKKKGKKKKKGGKKKK